MTFHLLPERLRELFRSHPAAVLILLAYVVLASAYNLANPLFEAPDELLHYQFIRYLQEAHRLPEVDLEGQISEYHQPPLYYVIASLLSPRGSEPPLPHYTTVNPFWGYEIGRVGDDNKNQFLHPPEGFPYSLRRQSIHVARLLSTLFGAGTVLLTYFLARRFVDARTAAASMAVVAFTPNFLLTSGAVTNDSLIILLSAAAGLVLVDLTASERPPRISQWVVLSILLGLGMLAKLSFWPLLPTTAVGATLLALRQRSWRLFAAAGVILLAGVALIGGWWALRNYRLYGDLTGLSSMWSVWGVRPPLTISDYLVEGRNFRTTFWGNFGYGNVPLPGWGYTLLDLFMIGGAAGLAVKLIQSRGTRIPRERRDQIIVMIIWAVLTFAALIWYLQKTFSVTGRQLYPIFPVLALGLAVGLSAFAPHQHKKWAAAVISAGMLALGVGALTGVLIPAYAPSPRVSIKAAEASMTQELRWRVGETATLLGYRLEPEMVQPGHEAVVTLFWLPEEAPGRNYTEFVHIIGEGGALIGARDTYPGLGNNPTLYWEPGSVIVDRIPVPVAADADGPVLAEIEVGLYVLESSERLPVTDAAGNLIGYPLMGTIKIADTDDPDDTPAETLDSLFEGGNRLLGYSLADSTAAPGESLELTLHWQTVGALPASYTVFVHLIGEDGAIAAQTDGIPRGGRYPTTAWGTGEVFTDPYNLKLDSVEPGAYRLRMGLYDPATGARLLLDTGADYVELPATVTVE
jgi:4-amino-4-deoxy-L-arabinose transferase-like glycosyltransferase